MSEPTTTVPHLRANSIVPIQLSLSHVNSLYGIYQVLLKGISAEHVQALKLKIESRQPLNDHEMAILSISTILHLVHTSAQEHDLIEQLPVDSFAKDTISHVTADQ